MELRQLAMPNAHFHSLRQAILQLGLHEGDTRAMLPPEFARLDPAANIPVELRESLADWLLAPSRAPAIQAAIRDRAERARGYLESVGLRAGDPVGVVDAGWFGTIHRNLERLLGSESRPARLTGFYLGVKPPAASPPAGTMLGYTNQFAPLPLLFDEAHKVLIELMAQSDHGQVVGFESADKNFAPIMIDSGPVNLGEIRLFHRAILTFVERMMETAELVSPAPDEFARTVIELYRDFHDRPSKSESRLFGFLPHADQLFEQRHASLCANFTWRQSLAAIVNYRRRPPHWWITGQAAIGQAPLLHLFRHSKRAWWRLQGKEL